MQKVFRFGKLLENLRLKSFPSFILKTDCKDTIKKRLAYSISTKKAEKFFALNLVKINVNLQLNRTNIDKVINYCVNGKPCWTVYL